MTQEGNRLRVNLVEQPVRGLLILLWRHCSVHVIILYITFKMMSSLDLSLVTLGVWSPQNPSEAKKSIFSNQETIRIPRGLNDYKGWHATQNGEEKKGENGPHL